MLPVAVVAAAVVARLPAAVVVTLAGSLVGVGVVARQAVHRLRPS
jgi:hypothetical protein